MGFEPMSTRVYSEGYEPSWLTMSEYICAPGGSRTHDRALYLYGLKDRCTGPLCDRCVSCAPGRDRTYDSSVKSRVLYHLSYERVYFCAIRISANRVTVYISVYISFSVLFCCGAFRYRTGSSRSSIWRFYLVSLGSFWVNDESRSRISQLTFLLHREVGIQLPATITI